MTECQHDQGLYDNGTRCVVCNESLSQQEIEELSA